MMTHFRINKAQIVRPKSQRQACNSYNILLFLILFHSLPSVLYSPKQTAPNTAIFYTVATIVMAPDFICF
jgi:hypothetical protein